MPLVVVSVVGLAPLKKQMVKRVKIFTGSWVHGHGAESELATCCGGCRQTAFGMTGVKQLR